MKNRTVVGFLSVAFSRGVSLASSIAVGLFLPKILDVTGYGYFKIFTLYAAYTALLHFGFVDGILVQYAGEDYDKLDKKKFRRYTEFFMVFQLVVSVILACVCVFYVDSEYSFIVLMLAINMLFVNVTTYYQFVSQAVKRFREFSAKNVISSIVRAVFIAILFALYRFNGLDVSYRVYLLGLNCIECAMMIWYICIYRDITFGEKTDFSSVKLDIILLFKKGIVLTVAYQVSHLVLALDRQFVNVLYSTETFAKYSFAYNIVSMISTMVSSLSIVLLPVLKKASKDIIVSYYKKSAIVVSLVVGVFLAGYFPLVKFLHWFLPDYVASLEYIRIVLPSLLFTSAITVVMFTLDKVLEQNIVFFKISCIALAIGFVTNSLAHVIFKTPEAISYASLVTVAIWFFIEGAHLKKKINVSVRKEFVYISVLSLAFLLITRFVEPIWLSAIAYIVFYLIFTLLIHRNFLQEQVFFRSAGATGIDIK